MPVRFKTKYPDMKHWHTVNELPIAVLGTGAYIDTNGQEVVISATSGVGQDFGARIKVEITTDVFEKVAQAMMDTDPDAALKAFGQALVTGARRPVYEDDGRELG